MDGAQAQRAKMRNPVWLQLYLKTAKFGKTQARTKRAFIKQHVDLTSGRYTKQPSKEKEAGGKQA